MLNRYRYLLSITLAVIISLTLISCNKSEISNTGKSGNNYSNTGSGKTTVKSSVSVTKRPSGSTLSGNTTQKDSDNDRQPSGDNSLPSGESGNTQPEDTEPGSDEGSDNGEDTNISGILIDKNSVDFKGGTLTIAGWSQVLYPTLGVDANTDKAYYTWKRAEEKYNCKTEYKMVAYADHYNSFTQAALAGVEYADLIVVDTHYFPLLPDNGFIEPLDEYIDYNNSWHSNYEKLTAWKGKHYGIPRTLSADGYATVYNYKILEKEGLTDILELSKIGEWNWNSFLDVCIRTTRDFNGDGIIDQWGLGGSVQQALLSSNQVAVIDEADGVNKCALFDRKGLNALQFFYDLFYTYKVVDSSKNIFSNASFIAGVQTIFINPPYVTMAIKSAGMTTVRVAPLPLGPDVDDYKLLLTGVQVWSVPSAKSYDTGTLVCFINDAISNVWDPDNPDYLDPKKSYIESGLNRKIYDTYEEAEIMYDMQNKNSPVFYFLQGVGDVKNTIQKQIYDPISKGTPVSTVVDQNKVQIQSMIDEIMNK